MLIGELQKDMIEWEMRKTELIPREVPREHAVEMESKQKLSLIKLSLNRPCLISRAQL
jgi:hypothetical protein